MLQNFKDFFESLLKYITEKLSKPEPRRPDPNEGELKSLWYPHARIPDVRMQTQGKYAKNYPLGAVVHYTAGHSLAAAAEHGREMGYCYFIIDVDGVVHQSFPLDEWGYHCGQSYFKELGSSLSKHLVGIEIICAGEVEKKPNGSFKTWFDKEVPAEKVRVATKEKYGIVKDGYYEKFTLAQEASLEKLLVWLKDNSPEVFMIDNVLGHHEISPDRKKDPGGSLYLPMADLRNKIRRQYNDQYRERTKRNDASR